MVGREARFRLPRRVIGDDEFQRVQHRSAARRDIIQMLTHAIFKQAVIEPAIRFRYAAALHHHADAFRCVASATRTGDGRQARVVPAIDVLFSHQLVQIAFAEHDISKIETRKLILAGKGISQVPGVTDMLKQPIVVRTLILEFEGTN